MPDALEDHPTPRFGHPLRHLRSCGSSNLEALRWAREDPSLPEGAVVLTEEQTAGRGRWGRSWLSSPGSSLMFSLVLKPSFPLDRAGLLTTALGVSVADAITEVTSLPSLVKWPNDVMIGSSPGAALRKLAGILVETEISPGGSYFAVAGVGVNMTWTTDEVPAEISGHATSLAIEMRGPLPTSRDLMDAILTHFAIRYSSLGSDLGRAEVIEAATRASCVLGSEVDLRWASGRQETGRAVRLMPDGSLEVHLGANVEVVTAAEIERVRPT